ncbi:MAG: hypothetical protein IPF87_09770 [Gemmatimonadetes bacterium]|nr:hypothetical protein [Gemmatimonadota bacterium]
MKLAREELWMVPIPADPSERVVLADRRGRLVLSAYAVYTDVTGARDFEAYVQPVLRTLAASRSRCILTLFETPETFDAGRTRFVVQAARELGLASMVEIRGTWGRRCSSCSPPLAPATSASRRTSCTGPEASPTSFG